MSGKGEIEGQGIGVDDPAVDYKYDMQNALLMELNKRWVLGAAALALFDHYGIFAIYVTVFMPDYQTS